MRKHKWGSGSTSGLSNPQASFWTFRLCCFPGYVTLRKVTGTQAKSENKKNLQAMAMLKLPGRQVLSDSEITFCGHLSERSKWKFPTPWLTLSFRSKSLWAWGIREAQNFKLLSPGERGHQAPCISYQLCANPSTCNHDNRPQRVHVGPSFRWEPWGSERQSNVINAISKLEFEARFAWYQSRNLFSQHSFRCCS